MDRTVNNISGRQLDSDDSSVSLDTCEMTPLSPHAPDLDRMDQATTSCARGHVIIDGEQRQMAFSDLVRLQKDGSWQWKIAFTVGFTVITVALILAISYEMKKIQCSEDKEKRIMDRYKGLFMTKGEMDVKLAEMKMSDHLAPVIDSSRVPHYNCTLNKFGGTDEPRIGKTTSRDGVFFHGCCETRLEPQTFDFLPDTGGVVRRVVQFMDRFQYFYVEKCNHTMHCSLPCTCTQHQRFVTALVADDNLENERLTSVVYFGSCKCLNTDIH